MPSPLRGEPFDRLRATSNVEWGGHAVAESEGVPGRQVEGNVALWKSGRVREAHRYGDAFILFMRRATVAPTELNSENDSAPGALRRATLPSPYGLGTHGLWERSLHGDRGVLLLWNPFPGMSGHSRCALHLQNRTQLPRHAPGVTPFSRLKSLEK